MVKRRGGHWQATESRSVEGWWMVDKSGEQSYERGKVKLVPTVNTFSWQLSACFLFFLALYCTHAHTHSLSCFNVTRIPPCSSVVNVQPVKTCDPAMVGYSSTRCFMFWSLIHLDSTCCRIDCQHCKELFGSCGSWQDACWRDWCK